MAVGNRNGNLPVEPSRPAQGRIEDVGKIGGRNDNDLVPLRKPVHQRQQLGDHPLLHFAHHLVAAGRNRIQFVEENNARRLAAGLFEDLPQMGFAFAVKLMDDFGTADGKEIRLRLVRDGPRDQRLAASGRAVQKHAFRRVNSQPLENFRVAQRKLNHFPDSEQMRLQSANVLIGDRSLRYCLGLKLGDQKLRSPG